MVAPETTARGRRLASTDPTDHPNAVPEVDCTLHAHSGEKRCAIKRTHPPHPYGPIHPRGGLAHWCLGRTI